MNRLSAVSILIAGALMLSVPTTAADGVDQRQPSPTDVTIVNLLANPGFEDGVLTPWVGQGDWAVTSANAHSGTYSAECTTGHTIRQNITPTGVGDIIEVSIWCRSLDVAEHPVQLFYNASGSDWDEFLLWPGGSSWEHHDLTADLRSSGFLHGILVYGSSGHVVRLDDAIISIDEPLAVDSETWGGVKALFR